MNRFLIKRLGIWLGVAEEPSLLGLWQRIGDKFAGCVLSVHLVKSQPTAIIFSITKEMVEYGWKVGDVKWKSIRRDSVGRYVVDDLYKTLNRKQKSIKEEYHPAQLEFTSDNVIKTTALEYVESSGSGTQRWRRVRLAR